MPAQSELRGTVIPFSMTPNVLFEHIRPLRGHPEYGRIIPYAIAVYVFINKHVDADHHAFPGQGYIADMCGMTRPTVRKALRALAFAGLLTAEYQPGKQQSLIYTLNRGAEAWESMANYVDDGMTKTPASVNTVAGNTVASKRVASNSIAPNNTHLVQPDPPTQLDPLSQAPQKSRKQSPAKNQISGTTNSSASDQQFESQFWPAYPRHDAKQTALVAWNKLSASDRLAAIAGIERLKQSSQWQRDDGQYIPHASTYLNQARWTDDAAPARPSGHQVTMQNFPL